MPRAPKPEPLPEPLGSLEASVRKSVEGMPWLTPSDNAAIELAATYAARIDRAVDGGDEQAATKALYLGPHLLNTLRALGGAPIERKALTSGEAQEVDPIDELKRKRAGRAQAG